MFLRRLSTLGVRVAAEQHDRAGGQKAFDSLAGTAPGEVTADTALPAAADLGSAPLVHWLLAHGANPRPVPAPSSRHTALHAIVRAANLSVAQLLVAAGANLSAVLPANGPSPPSP